MRSNSRRQYSKNRLTVLSISLCLAVVALAGGSAQVTTRATVDDSARVTAPEAAYIVTSLVDNTSATPNNGTLRGAILAANQDAGAATITFNIAGGGTITLARMLPLLVNPNGISIDGANGGQGAITISGNNADRIFFIGISAGETASSSTLLSTASTTFALSNLRLNNGRAIGGKGGDCPASGPGGAGGGGAGLGGAIFLNAGTLNIANLQFLDNSAVGGNGGSATVAGSGAAAGGGGMGGPGGNSNTHPGGGGGFGIGANGANSNGAGTAGFFTGGTGRNGAPGGTTTGSGGATGGGGGGGSTTATGGAGGGVRGTGGTGSLGKMGGFGGGGGGAGSFTGGFGGYGGGGGGNGSNNTGGGGGGGFGGGGGGSRHVNGGGGFGAGDGKSPGGGGGAGLGGSVFVRQGATLNVTDGSFSGSTITGGTPGTNGAAGQGIGQSLFLAGQATYTVTSGTLTLSETIGGGTSSEITGGLTANGPGQLNLTAANSYTGPTNVNGGTLALVGNGSFAGSSPINVGAGGILNVTGVTGGANFNSGQFALASGQTLGGNGTVTGPVQLRSGSGIGIGANLGQLTLNSNVTLVGGANFNLKIGGTTPVIQHDQIVAAAALDLGNATLVTTAFNGFVPTDGQQFKIIDKTSAGPITGTFNGLPEGATISYFLGPTMAATISYVGGDGNDVVLTAFAPPLSDVAVTISDSPDPVGADENITYTINFINNGPFPAAAVNVTNGIPSGTSFVSASVTSGSGWSTSNPPVGGTGTVIGFSKGTVASGETAVFTIVLKVDPFMGGSIISDTVDVATTNQDPVTSNNSDSCSTEVLMTYATVANGNWSDDSIWLDFNVPPSSVSTNERILILHNVNYDSFCVIGSGALLEIRAPGALTVPAGRTLTNNGSLNNAGTLTINGTFTDAGVVSFNGASPQSVGGTAALAFKSMVVNNTAGVTLNRDASISTSLTLTSGKVTMSAGKTLTLGSAATMNRTSGSVVGMLKKQFTGNGTFTYPVGTAAGYAPVTAVVSTPGSGDFTVTTNDGALAGTIAGQSLTRNWTLTKNNITSADITFSYNDADVPGGANESQFSFVRRSGTTNIELVPSSFDTTANTFTRLGVTGFSDWGLGKMAGPLSATVPVTGRISTAYGRGISGVYVTLTSQTGFSRTISTGSFGYYQFNDVEVGQIYVLTVASKRYLFSDPQRLIAVMEAMNGQDFVADP